MKQKIKEMARDLRKFLVASGENPVDLDDGASVVFSASEMIGENVVIVAPLIGEKYNMYICSKTTGLVVVSAYVYNAVEVIANLVKYKREEKS